MSLIKSAEYKFDPAGAVIECKVTYMGGITKVITDKNELTAIQEQLQSQQKQFLVE